MRTALNLSQNLLAGVMMSLAVSATAETPTTGGTLVVGGGAGIRHLNPAVQTGGATGVPGSQIFAGLVRIDGDFKPQPYLARSWQVSLCRSSRRVS